MTWTIHQKRFFKWIIEECRLPHELILLVIPKMIIDTKSIPTSSSKDCCDYKHVPRPSKDYAVYVGKRIVFIGWTIKECIAFIDNHPEYSSYDTEIDFFIFDFLDNPPNSDTKIDYFIDTNNNVWWCF
jgi:hypothetical protein